FHRLTRRLKIPWRYRCASLKDLCQCRGDYQQAYNSGPPIYIGWKLYQNERVDKLRAEPATPHDWFLYLPCTVVPTPADKLDHLLYKVVWNTVGRTAHAGGSGRGAIPPLFVSQPQPPNRIPGHVDRLNALWRIGSP